MRTEIKKLHQSLDASMVYVTHDQIEAMTLATKIVVMKSGIIQQIEPAEITAIRPISLWRFHGLTGNEPDSCRVEKSEKGQNSSSIRMVVMI